MKHTDSSLDALRMEGDPLADRVVREIVAAGQVDLVNSVLRHLRDNDQPIPEQLPEVVRDYLRSTEDLPDWADYTRLARVRDFFLDDGLDINAVLCLGAMVGCYAVPHGAKLLAMTHRLDHPQHRMAETGQFCFYLMEEHAFQHGGHFIPAVQKVRLIHAAIRRVFAESGQWPVEEYGVPICQEDMLGALMLFSYEVLDGMKRLGLTPTQQEAEDYYYTWRVAGTMLGIREDIIPETLEEAAELCLLLKKRQIGPSPEGVRLTRSLIEMFEEMTPGKFLDGAIPSLIRFIVQDETADYMEIPHTKWDGIIKRLPSASQFLEEAEDRSTVIRKVLDKAGWALLMGQMRMLTGGERYEYFIAEDLRAAWHRQPTVEGE